MASPVIGADKVEAEYNPDVDVLEVELGGDRVKRSRTFAYEDLFLFHLGVDSETGEPALQGMTIIGYKSLRKRLHGEEAELDEASLKSLSAELADFLSHLSLETTEKQMLLKDTRSWDKANRLAWPLAPHVRAVEDMATGEPVGIVIESPEFVTEETLVEVLDTILDPLLLPEEDQEALAAKEPERYRFGAKAAKRFVQPLLVGAH